MEKMEPTWVSPVLSVLSAQGGRVTGKAAKERPKQNKKRFREYLHPDSREGSDSETEDRLDTLA
ncbi:MAG: hypothetical protein VB107_11100 [Aminivibrio sp.]|uniref:hypothetical protein n=1 Tax=Aminivibrio sp. TaxID=1872489 RepID=UPI002B20EF99|nr:hypothetical protein [Aminivibrio sp.]MEA4953214.1 hypothetical protein [Aminivibrio sp.]